jgi:hypothetical protein
MSTVRIDWIGENVEYFIQITDQLEGRLCHGLVVWTQPDQDMARILVDEV